MRKFLLFFAFACLHIIYLPQLFAQNGPSKQWDKTFGGNSRDDCYSLQQTSDGGYIIGGTSTSGVSGDKSQPNYAGVSTISTDYWILKLDSTGNKQWDKTIGGTGNDWLRCIRQTTDGGYILGGYSGSPISGDKSQGVKDGWGIGDYWIVKVDANGTKQWDKTIGGDNSDYLYSIEQTSDGGYILGGSSESGIGHDKTAFNLGFSDYWVVKVDAFGNIIWEKSFGGLGSDQLTTIKQTADGGYIIGGYSTSPSGSIKTHPNRGFEDFWIIKLNASGVKLWDRTLGGSGGDQLHSIQETADGNFIMGGWSTSGISFDKTQPVSGVDDFWVVKVNANGTKIWDKTFGGNSGDQLSSLQQTIDGGYILGGHSYSGISGSKTQASRGMYDYWVLKLDGNGNKIWDKAFGGSDNDKLYALQQTKDSGYVLGGTSYSGISPDKTEGSKGLQDFWIIKLGANCSELTASLSLNCVTTGPEVKLNVTGMLPSIAGTQNWTLNYTVNGVSQTASGSSSVFTLATNAPAGALYSLVSISSGSCTSNLTGTLSIEAIPTAPTVISANRCGNGTLTLSASGVTTGGKYIWYDAAAGGTVLQNSTLGTFTTPGLSATTTYYVALSNSNGCEGPRTQAIATITNLTVIPGPAQTICETAASVQLSGFSPTGGTWSGAGVSSSGLFTPAFNLIGNQTLTYTVTQNGCTATATKTITVTPEPVVNAGPSQSVCANGTPIQLVGFSPAGGTWSGPGVASGGVFTPSASLIGTQTLTYEVSQNGCTSSATKTLTITAPPVVNVGSSQTICATASPLQLTGFSPAGGTWSGSGISSGGLFTPNNSLVGNQTLTYTVSQNGCTESAQQLVSVTATPIVFAGPDDTICSNGAPIQLTGFSPLGGSWTGPGIDSTGLFTPSASLTGIQTLAYTFSQNGCLVSTTKQINVVANPAQPLITLISPDTLISSIVGNAYEWKQNGTVLTNTSRKLKVLANGLYSVQVKNLNNCNSPFSADYNYLTSGVKQFLVKDLKFFPNPTSGIVTLELRENLNGQVTVFNKLGQLVLTKNVRKTDNNEQIQLDLSKEAKGVYTIQVLLDNQVVNRKVVLQ